MLISVLICQIWWHSLSVFLPVGIFMPNLMTYSLISPSMFFFQLVSFMPNLMTYSLCFFQLVLRRHVAGRRHRPPHVGARGRSFSGQGQHHHPGRLRLMRQVSKDVTRSKGFSWPDLGKFVNRFESAHEKSKFRVFFWMLKPSNW